MFEILLVDDEPAIRLTIGDVLTRAGHKVTLAADGEKALEQVNDRLFDLVITDIRLPKLNGLELFRRIRGQAPETDVILMTAHGAVEDAVAALKAGAHDYLLKPFDLDEVIIRVGRLAEARALKKELLSARVELAQKAGGANLIGRSPAMVHLLDRIATIAHSEAAVMITGESGTGKELVAHRLHELSQRAGKPFIAVNCAAFPETLLEAELFGYERGAFTGAVKRREGRFKAADGGTLFLDEVAEIPPLAQAKLLRVLQEGNFEPLGTNATVKADVRVISATHRNLKLNIAEGRFREDLYYRLNVLTIPIPPLRDRRGDLPILVEAFLRRFAPKDPPSLSPTAWAALSEYAFPGNVRELEHAIEHAVVLSRGKEIGLEHLPVDVVGVVRDREQPGGTSLRSLAVAAREFEREYLLRALGLTQGKKGQAAEVLGISRKNLWEKLRAHGIHGSDDDE